MDDKQTRWQASGPLADLTTTGTAGWAVSGRNMGQTVKEWTETNGDLLGLAVALIVIVAVVVMAVYLHLKRPRFMPLSLPREPEQGGSRFDQLLAEIQGLSLRIRGGDSKHYFRKIEQLSRVYLERSGYAGATRMTETELDGLLKSDRIAQQQAAAIRSIVERARQGSQRENQPLEYTASDLLRELSALVMHSEGTSHRGD